MKEAVNPYFEFSLRKEDTSVLVVGFGETGNRVRMRFSDPELLEVVAHNFSKIGNMIEDMREIGWDETLEKYGLEIDDGKE